MREGLGGGGGGPTGGALFTVFTKTLEAKQTKRRDNKRGMRRGTFVFSHRVTVPARLLLLSLAPLAASLALHPSAGGEGGAWWG